MIASPFGRKDRKYCALGIVGLALAGLWYAGGGTTITAPASATASELRVLPPATHENLTVYFLRGREEASGVTVATLPEAMEAGWAVVSDAGGLTVENRSSDCELFVQEGDIIRGGKQDRVIASDLLVPPNSGPVSCPCHCVERGRSSPRGTEDATRFNACSQFAGSAIRSANAARNQGGVWGGVAEEQAKLSKNLHASVTAAASPTSLQLTLEHAAVAAGVAPYLSALQAVGESEPDLIGAVFLVNGRVTGADIYGSCALFRKAWPKLLRAAATDAVAEKSDRRMGLLPSAAAIAHYLATVARREAEPSDVASPVIPGNALTQMAQDRYQNWTVGHRINMPLGEGNDSTRARAGEKRFSVNLNGRPWKDVLDWFADESGLVPILPYLPTGSVTLQTDVNRKYTIAEIVDLLNEALQQQKFILFRRLVTFIILSTDERIDSSLVPRIEVADLPSRGKTEIVQILIPLNKAENSIPEMAKLLTPLGQISTLHINNTFVLVDTAGNVQRILNMLEEVESKRTTALAEKLARALDSMRNNKAVTSVQPPNPSPDDPGATVNGAAVPSPQPTGPSTGNRLAVTRIETAGALTTESRDSARQNALIHKSIIQHGHTP